MSEVTIIINIIIIKIVVIIGVVVTQTTRMNHTVNTVDKRPSQTDDQRRKF